MRLKFLMLPLVFAFWGSTGSNKTFDGVWSEHRIFRGRSLPVKIIRKYDSFAETGRCIWSGDSSLPCNHEICRATAEWATTYFRLTEARSMILYQNQTRPHNPNIYLIRYNDLPPVELPVYPFDKYTLSHTELPWNHWKKYNRIRIRVTNRSGYVRKDIDINVKELRGAYRSVQKCRSLN